MLTNDIPYKSNNSKSMNESGMFILADLTVSKIIGTTILAKSSWNDLKNLQIFTLLSRFAESKNWIDINIVPVIFHDLRLPGRHLHVHIKS